MSTRTVVFGLKVYRGCKIAKIVTEIFDVLMGKILPLDVLDILVGGVGDINVNFPDKVNRGISCPLFPTALLLLLKLVALGRGLGLQRVLCVLWLWEVVVVVAVLCQGR